MIDTTRFEQLEMFTECTREINIINNNDTGFQAEYEAFWEEGDEGERDNIQV
ncbi:hypothetical protein IC620_15580 [Hazenella sp. IB182357]|uniref:Uncharacterized protein n=1 Tax=Polycladospora coralii TaxID=2771432 RepID=A0A926N858_9BACL|nr:hypothetical protein [Polycladospora coralii]MBD1373766.1 hypothetical protein [Polycladospora coralii]